MRARDSATHLTIQGQSMDCPWMATYPGLTTLSKYPHTPLLLWPSMHGSSMDNNPPKANHSVRVSTYTSIINYCIIEPVMRTLHEACLQWINTTCQCQLRESLFSEGRKGMKLLQYYTPKLRVDLILQGYVN